MPNQNFRGGSITTEKGGEVMQLSRWRKAGTRLSAIVIVAFMAVACSDTPKPENELGPGGRLSPATPGSTRDFATNVGDIVYFTTDSVDLSPEATQTLTNQARWLQQYSQYTITIEGHADERGTREYNIALGARRAQTVRNFLAQHGINAQRIRTISYGKERPVAVCNDISCWSQNRRAQTVLNSRHEARS
jgi:peptidoglycan-associated lipoprotein